jgi:ketosteroid isomerase-like protein
MSSANVDLAQSIFAAWGRGDYSSAAWARPEIELVAADGPSPGTWKGLAGIAEGMRDLLNAWNDLRIVGHEFCELDDGRVLVLARFSGRGKTSGLDLGEMRAQVAGLFEFQAGKVTRYTYWLDAKHALAELGLDMEAPSADA